MSDPLKKVGIKLPLHEEIAAVRQMDRLASVFTSEKRELRSPSAGSGQVALKRFPRGVASQVYLLVPQTR